MPAESAVTHPRRIHTGHSRKRTRKRCGFCNRIMADHLVVQGRIYCTHADCRKAREGLV